MRAPYELAGNVVVGNNKEEKKKYNGRLKSSIKADDIDRICTPIEMPVSGKGVSPMLRRRSEGDTLTKKAKGRRKSA